jgi:signal peptide peptidase SppA
MSQPRNLPHIAAMAFNEPLLLEPAYARVFFCTLGQQLGIPLLNDGLTGDSLNAQDMQAVMATPGFPARESPQRSYQIQNGIAVLPVSGTLVPKGSLQPYSGMTGYNGIVARLQQAMSDPAVDGVLLDLDTPGGHVSGAFDCADVIARLRDQKPVWALANDMNCSSGQLLASACSRRLVTQTARTGSIGVMMAHSNYSAALEKQGVQITLLYSGEHKVDGNPWAEMKPEVRERLQSRMDSTRRMFAEKVAGYTGLTVDAILATEAQVYEGAEALQIGLADELVLNTDAIGVMRDALNSGRRIITTGENMKTQSNEPQAAVTLPADATLSVADVNTQIHAAVTAENARIMGILGCSESSGREALAQALAGTPGMTVEQAQVLLSASPQSAQARSNTALDALMETSPETLSSSAGGQSGDAVCDLMSIPV